MTKSELLIPVFCVRFIHFAVEFCFLCDFIFHDKWHSIQVWQWRDLPKPIAMLCQRIATNGIASFCIDHRWRQMAFFRVFQNWKGPTFARLTWNKATFIWMQSLILYYIKQIDSMLPCICPVIDHRGRQNVVRTSVTHSAIASCATYLFLPHFDVICDLLQDRCTATWNLFVNYIITQVILAFWLALAYDLLEDRCTIDVITTKFFRPCFKMAASFENLDNILHDWA